MTVDEFLDRLEAAYEVLVDRPRWHNTIDRREVPRLDEACTAWIRAHPAKPPTVADLRGLARIGTAEPAVREHIAAARAILRGGAS